MMRVLFVTLNAGGNLPPALGIAAELKRRGDDVRFLGHGQQRASIEAAGFRFQSYRRGRDYDASKPRRTLDGLLDFTALVADKGLSADVLEAAFSEPTDVVVIDCLLFRALADAVAAQLPVVQLMHTLASYVEANARGPVGIVARLRGVNGRAAIAAPGLTLVTTRPEFDAPASSFTTRHTGFVWQGRPVVARPRPTPRVLVSMSTTSFPGQTEAIQHVIDALSELDVEAIVTTGQAVGPDSLRARNATVHRWLDHGELLPECSLVIGHGGHSTVARSLSFGIPMLLLPMHPLLDQPAVARAVAAQGACLVLPKKATPARIRSAVISLLVDGPHRDAARRLGESVRQNDGAVLAAELIDEFRRTAASGG